MVTREELKGHWNEVKGRLKEHWGELTEDDFSRIEGGADRLVGAIQQKTGATRREVEQVLNRCMEESGMYAAQAMESAQHYAASAADAMHASYDRTAELAEEASRRLVESVRTRPGQAIAVAFGVGIAAGLLLAVGRRRG